MIEQSSSSSSSSQFVSVKTETLTEAMFAEMKEGYAADLVILIEYEGLSPCTSF